MKGEKGSDGERQLFFFFSNARLRAIVRVVFGGLEEKNKMDLLLRSNSKIGYTDTKKAHARTPAHTSTTTKLSAIGKQVTGRCFGGIFFPPAFYYILFCCC